MRHEERGGTPSKTKGKGRKLSPGKILTNAETKGKKKDGKGKRQISKFGSSRKGQGRNKVRGEHTRGTKVVATEKRSRPSPKVSTDAPQLIIEGEKRGGNPLRKEK